MHSILLTDFNKTWDFWKILISLLHQISRKKSYGSWSEAIYADRHTYGKTRRSQKLHLTCTEMRLKRQFFWGARTRRRPDLAQRHKGLLTACEQDQGRVPSWPCSQAVSKPVWHIPLLCVQWKTPDDGQRNCPKHVEFYSKNRFAKLVHLVGFIIRL